MTEQSAGWGGHRPDAGRPSRGLVRHSWWVRPDQRDQVKAAAGRLGIGRAQGGASELVRRFIDEGLARLDLGEKD